MTRPIAAWRSAPERRTGPRRRSTANAWVSATGFGTARCRLINLSDDGAQITAPPGLRVGNRVTLTLRARIKRRASVVWVEADIIGLRFITG